MQNITIDSKMKFDFILHICTIKQALQSIRVIFMQYFVFDIDKIWHFKRGFNRS